MGIADAMDWEAGPGRYRPTVGRQDCAALGLTKPDYICDQIPHSDEIPCPRCRPFSSTDGVPASGSLPHDHADRKAAPMAEGCLWYFPNALAEVARVSKAGNDQHNPGQPMHHARGKSMDHADCILRHLVDAGHRDTDGLRHTAKVAWRALALLQEEIERDEGVPLPRNARPANG